MRVAAIPVCLVFVAAGCGDPSSTLLLQVTGTWGGDEAGLIATDSTAHVHIGCSQGDAGGPIVVSGNRFDVPARYNLFAYPVYREGDERPARFSGTVSGDVVTLTVTMVDTAVTLGPVRLVRGREPTMANCPICRLPGDQSRPMPR
jgi:hypothetical protein